MRLTFHNKEEVHMKGILWKLVKSTRTIIRLEAEQNGRILVNSLTSFVSFFSCFVSFLFILTCFVLFAVAFDGLRKGIPSMFRGK